jgi:formylglycine-generating enzyme required for sulfatase activity
LYDYVHTQVVNRTPKQTPAMWSYKQKEEIVVARNPHPVVKPVELPSDLQVAIQSTSVWMREGAVLELERLLHGSQADLARAASIALNNLANDDSRRVSVAARKSLDSYAESSRLPAREQTGPDRMTLSAERAATKASEHAFSPAEESASAERRALARPAPKSKQRLLLMGIPAIALIVILAVALIASQQGQSPTQVGGPALPLAEQMTNIAAGAYPLGRDSSGDNYAPTQSADVDEFWIDQHEVTNAQYAEFLAKSGGAPPASWPEGAMPAGQGDFPVEGVTWDQAAAFCGWANKRLPTEAEWEVAARGPEGWLYPWGNDEHFVELPDGGTYAAGKVPANRSAFGVYDMAGNVWEWVGDTYAPVPDGHKVLRGGGYGFLKDMAYRLHGDPNVRTLFAMAGIRCAADNVSAADNKTKE